MSFIALNTYSGFTYLQSAFTPETLIDYTKKMGYSACALCDLDTLAGYAPFTHSCLKKGIKPIYGTHFSLFPELCLFVLNEKGYQNLLLLEEKRVNLTLKEEDFYRHSEGLYAVISLKEKISYPSSFWEKLAKAYSHLSLGLPKSKDENFLRYWRDFAKSHSLDIMAFPAIRYPKKEDAVSLLILNAIRSRETLTVQKAEGEEFFPSLEELKKYYLEEEIEKTNEVLLSSSFSYIQKRGSLLRFPEAKEMGADTYLSALAHQKLKEKGKDNPAYLARLKEELSIIAKMGYSDYFLIVADYVSFAKKRGILVGPGRGSGAGSLVSYALGIVQPDPLEHGLLFERFLNPERQSMPDIDVDFEDTRREEVVAYLSEKYQKERCAHVLTTQTIGAKEALRDIGRVYSIPVHDINLLCGSILNEKISLREDYKTNPIFRDYVKSDTYYLNIVSLAAKIEGLPRQAGLHAAGILLNETPLAKVLPIELSPSEGQIAQLEKDYLEEQGFLKMDLLGLRNLSLIRSILESIEEEEGVHLTYEELPIRDKEALSLIEKGETMGLFQLESPGMKNAIRLVRPERFEDVAAIEALFRPGPMEQISTYAKRKAGEEKTTYLFPELEPILKETYGIIVYQEQIMEICRSLAGMSYGEADLFRRAISKKDHEKLLSLKPRFVEAVIKKGKKEKEAEALYALIERFANYGFNKSHAVSYAYLTCQMAYLKAHFPKEFYSCILATMNSEEKKFRNTLSELKRRGVKLLLPSLNASAFSFHAEKDGIRSPLSFIKGIPSSLTLSLTEERLEKGEYLDFFDFAKRAKGYGLTLPYLIRLIDGGACDCFHKNRATLRATAASALHYAEMFVGQDGQTVFLNLAIEKPSYQEREEDYLVKLEAEKEALGIMLSGSPLSAFRATIQKRGAIALSDLDDSPSPAWTYGMIKSVEARTTKNGRQMAFVELMDETSEVRFTLWGETYSRYYSYLKVDRPILALTRHNFYQKKQNYIMEQIIPLSEEGSKR